MKQVLLSITFLLFFLSSFSQFEGRIVYSVDYEAPDPDKKEMISMLPKQSMLTVKGSLSLFEQEVAGGGRQAFIINAGQGSGILVMQFLGQEYKVEMSKDDIETLKETRKLDIHKSEEEKTIAGEPCLGALAMSDTDTLRVYYTKNITSNATFPPFAEIEGLPLEYELVRGGVKMKYKAVEIIRETVDPKVFAVDPTMNSIKFKDFARSFAVEKEGGM